ncbi:MAG: methionyl-tRNA formyltransferase [Candidatus Limimorpha sp.]
MKKIKIIYFGTPELAASQLEAILAAGYEIAAVVTAPDKPSGRGKKIHFSEVKETALRHDLPLLQPAKLKDPDFLKQLESFHADLFIVVAFRMLPAAVWTMPRLGTFNLHASLLPQYRGAAPINHAIINGETETGLTTFFLNEDIDKGAIIMQEKVAIRPDETAGELHDELMRLGNKLVVQTIQKIEQGAAHTIPQDQILNGMVLKEAPKIFKDFCFINWNRACTSINNLVRGLSPYPAAHARLVSDQNQNLDLKIFSCTCEPCHHNETVGSIRTDNKTFLKIAVPDGYIHLTVLQQSGKKRMSIEEFLRGFRFNETWKTAF